MSKRKRPGRFLGPPQNEHPKRYIDMTYLYVHRNNDYSGSSAALVEIIKKHGLDDSTVVSDFESSGFLKSSNYSHIINVKFKFRGRNLRTVLEFGIYFFQSFIKVLVSKKARNADVFYINTIFPWPVAILGRILRKKVVYHIHEFYVPQPGIMVRFFLKILVANSNENIFVSNYVKEAYLNYSEVFAKIPYKVEYTPARFETVNPKILDIPRKFSGPIVMICSARRYKGLEVFVEVAKLNPSRRFILLLSDEPTFALDAIPNLKIVLDPKDIKSTLRNASLCLNLTQPDKCIETYGLTIVESLSQGTPAVVPNVGGPLEIIDQSCGLSCDTMSVSAVNAAIANILSNEEIYRAYSDGAVSRSRSLSKNQKSEKLS